MKVPRHNLNQRSGSKFDNETIICTTFISTAFGMLLPSRDHEMIVTRIALLLSGGAYWARIYSVLTVLLQLSLLGSGTRLVSCVSGSNDPEATNLETCRCLVMVIATRSATVRYLEREILRGHQSRIHSPQPASTYFRFLRNRSAAQFTPKC